MIDRKTIGLINRELDGENTPEDSETLRTSLARDPEAQKLFDDLKKLARNFSALEPVEPPATLKTGIMRSVHERKLVPAASKKTRLVDLLIPVRTLPRLGFAFGGGLVAGILLVVMYFTFVSHPPIDNREASGTIISSSEVMQTADDQAISSQGVEGRIVTEYSNNMSVLKVNLSMPGDLDVRFVFDPDGASLKGITLADQFSGTLNNSEGTLQMGHGGGAFKAFFAQGAATTQKVRFQVISAGNVVFERSFTLGKAQ